LSLEIVHGYVYSGNLEALVLRQAQVLGGSHL
jgi:hypothetical protein